MTEEEKAFEAEAKQDGLILVHRAAWLAVFRLFPPLAALRDAIDTDVRTKILDVFRDAPDNLRNRIVMTTAIEEADALFGFLGDDEDQAGSRNSEFP
jgi:hypothetical protein